MSGPTMNAEKLAACPFCGKSHTLSVTTAQELAEQDSDYDGEFWEHSDSFAVICDASRPDGPGGCGASGGFFPTEAEALAAWNRRSQDAQAEPLTDRIRAELMNDTREVFDASGAETPQAVRDVIEYVDSWLQVYIQKSAERAHGIGEKP